MVLITEAGARPQILPRADNDAHTPALLSVAQVAGLTGLSPHSIYRAIGTGELGASKLRGRIRISLADIDQWIDAGRLGLRASGRRPPIPARQGQLNGPGRGLRELLEKE